MAAAVGWLTAVVVFVVVIVLNDTAAVTAAETSVIRASTAISVPFETQSSNGTLEGFAVDLLNALLEGSNFSVLLRTSADGTFGAAISPPNTTQPQFSGVIGEVQNGVADIGIGPITITASRHRVVDFTTPFLSGSLSLLVSKPQTSRGLFSFLEPFSATLWVSIVGVFIAAAVLLIIYDRLSPYSKYRKAKAAGRHLHRSRTVTIVQRTMDFAVNNSSKAIGRSCSSHLLSFGFAFFILIIVSSYTANLAAFLTVQRLQVPITRLSDLSTCNCRFGIRNATAQQQLFLTSPVYRQFRSNMVVFDTNDAAVAALRQGSISAFVGDAPILEYIANHPPCDTLVVGDAFAPAFYGFAVSRDRPDLTELLSVQILHLLESGEIDSLYRFWWTINASCTNVNDPNELHQSFQIGVYALRGLFIVVGGIAVISVVLLLLELLWHRCYYSCCTPRSNIVEPKHLPDRVDILFGGQGV